MVTIEQKLELSERILTFLETYACIRPDFDPEYDEDYEKYTSPDASMLCAYADSLKCGVILPRVWSEWGSGGYKPYADRTGQKEHSEILSSIYEYQKL